MRHRQPGEIEGNRHLIGGELARTGIHYGEHADDIAIGGLEGHAEIGAHAGIAKDVAGAFLGERVGDGQRGPVADDQGGQGVGAVDHVRHAVSGQHDFGGAVENG